MAANRAALAAMTAVLLAGTGLAGCSMAPDYKSPQSALPAAPAQFAEMAGWTQAAPGDADMRGDWWTAFGDPVLDDLESRAAAASPTLAAALARYDQAHAAAGLAASGLYPQVGVSGEASRQRVSAGRPLANTGPATYNDFVVGGSVSYELDLWGRVRNTVKAGKAEAEASAGDLASARLSLQASVADAYLRLRGLDAQARLLDDSVDAFQRALQLTETRHQGGIASGIDVNRARTVLGNAQAQVASVANDRAQTEHELAALTGALASDFHVAPRDAEMATPAIAVGTPSELLQRRPDIAAAERRVFAANAQIGVARAAWFPTISLGGSGGWQATHGNLLSAPNSMWALGPLTALLNVFDGGARRAQVKISRAEYDQAAADYRSTVLDAFREVEDSISAMRQLEAQGKAQREAADAAGRTSEIAMSRYRDGASGYLDVVTAQTDALAAQRSAIAVETDRMRAAVAYVRAIGGPEQAKG
ncbi:multidrug efflux system outer membrane protein [Novosphingobium sp. PhB165]|uniref:efflux transporter outer membrane subunit n=1 Tax=Novosphingobium sp. PhB165 TaxID=2485105 RepID=UPI0010442ED2|nr:efflux transporter outer membrane subunit [Novosphingobium sp. PhB165]TCM19670.1 multidrug efflux system outer membrane protein [Novosphingobium sp. PhB165]